jgi:parallel beta-helix repeat protein
MTTLAIGGSVTLTVGDGGLVSIATNGGFASVAIAPLTAAATVESFGPWSARRVFGPFSEGASLVLTNQSCGAFDYDYQGPALNSTQLAGLTGATVYAKAATGDPFIDAASLNAALLAAAGGVMRLPAGQTYVIGGKASQVLVNSAPPILIDGSGSTIQVTSAVVAATLSATASAGSTALVLQAGQGVLFAAGDRITLNAAAYATATYARATVASVTGDTLNIAALTMDAGTTLAAGSFVQHDNNLYIQQTGSIALTALPNTTLRNIVFDGNSTARIANGLRQSYSGNMLLQPVQVAMTIDNCTFKNAPCDAVEGSALPFFKVRNSHFENVFGNGIHPGGSLTTTTDVSIIGNTFSNVSQSTNATAPTIDQYGHAYQSGAIITSNGPKRMVVSGNIVDTASRWGFAASDVNDTEITLTGNIFYLCGAGGFHLYTSGKNNTVSGNIIISSGQRDVAHATGFKESSVVRGTSTGTTPSDTSITGNIFIDSPLLLDNDATDIVVTGNTFSAPSLTNVSGFTNVWLAGCIVIGNASSGTKNIKIADNKFRLPVNAVDALDGIHHTHVTNLSITGNQIVGGRFGVYSSGVCTNLHINNNQFVDQSVSSGGGNPRAWTSSNMTAFKGLQFNDNHCVVQQLSALGWGAVDLAGNAPTAGTAAIKGNTIRVGTRPTAGAFGIRFNQSAITWSGFQVTVEGNMIEMVNAADAPIIPPATGATTIHFLGNRMFGGSTPTLTGNTVAYGAADANFYA